MSEQRPDQHRHSGELEITVRCRCTRQMRPDAILGRGHMICGCGHTVYVEVPNRLEARERAGLQDAA